MDENCVENLKLKTKSLKCWKKIYNFEKGKKSFEKMDFGVENVFLFWFTVG